MADLERSSREQLEKINLLEVRVETLEQDYSALQEKASKLQDKAKTLAKEKKGISFSLGAGSFRVAFVFYAHVRFALTELKSLLLKKNELMTDLTNVMYRQIDVVEKLTKIQADSDKQMVEDMQRIKDLAAVSVFYRRVLRGVSQGEWL